MRNLTRALLALSLALLAPLARAEDRFFDSAGVRLRYVERGEGDAVVLIHGFSRDLELNWVSTGILEALAARHRVLALDCRGHGRSERPAAASAYGAEMVEDVARLLDHAGVGSAHVVGFSMGGRIAFKLAVTHPERVRSVVLLGIGSLDPSDDHGVVDRLALALERERTMRPLVDHIWPSDRPRPTAEELAGIDAACFERNDPLVLAAVARGFRGFDADPRQRARLRAPVLAIVGDDDPFRAEVERLDERVPAVEVEVLRGAAHTNLLRREELVEGIAAFWRTREILAARR